MTFGSLFAGVGGFDLGFERAGLKCEWQVEIEPYCRRVLEKHWPTVRRWDDVRTFPPEGEWGVDVICGGFPCQDISNAGKRAGIDGERSGLWSEYVRIIRLLRPRFVVVENVAALLVRGMDRVLGDLADSGYDAEWDSFQAAQFGAPHLRRRTFLLAYPCESSERRSHVSIGEKNQGTTSVWDGEKICSDQGRVSSPRFFGRKRRKEIKAFRRACNAGNSVWASEPDVDRMAHGIPNRLDRLEALGNAVVPQIAEWIGQILVKMEQK